MFQMDFEKNIFKLSSIFRKCVNKNKINILYVCICFYNIW